MGNGAGELERLRVSVEKEIGTRSGRRRICWTGGGWWKTRTSHSEVLWKQSDVVLHAGLHRQGLLSHRDELDSGGGGRGGALESRSLRLRRGCTGA